MYAFWLRFELYRGFSEGSNLLGFSEGSDGSSKAMRACPATAGLRLPPCAPSRFLSVARSLFGLTLTATSEPVLIRLALRFTEQLVTKDLPTLGFARHTYSKAKIEEVSHHDAPRYEAASYTAHQVLVGDLRSRLTGLLPFVRSSFL